MSRRDSAIQTRSVSEDSSITLRVRMLYPCSYGGLCSRSLPNQVRLPEFPYQVSVQTWAYRGRLRESATYPAQCHLEAQPIAAVWRIWQTDL